GNSWYNPFTSRQDLIRYMTVQNPGSNGTNALPYLTHFSRHVTAPTWGPDTTNEVTASTNVYLPSVQITNSTPPVTRITGETSTNGALVKYKFPLRRLTWLHLNTTTLPLLDQDALDYMHTLNGVPVGTDDVASLIQKAFGLQKTGNTWVYTNA